MNLAYAYRIAASFDYNHDGNIKTNSFFGSKELAFDHDAKRRTDTNNDGKISVGEFAQALANGDVFIGYDREVHSNNPFGGGQAPGYPYPGGGSPYYPGQQGPTTYPGSNYGGYGNNNYYPNSSYGSVLGGAAVGGAIGYISGGSNGLEKGAVIGGFLGAISNFFK